jgi:methionyl-tRNA synthetase
MARTYITTSIPYVNARPHVGYALELVQADALARARRRTGHEVRLLAGTDEHALKNVLAAAAAGVPTAEFVATNAAHFEALAARLAISLDDFIRTGADPRHAPAVVALWRRSEAQGDFYRRWYEGDYCQGCEQFYAPADLVDGRCPEHGTRPERVGESNWFFRLSRCQRQIAELIATDRLKIRPAPFRREVLAWVEAGLDDISVSRPALRARGWGVPVPGHPDQVVYVWWDALANYVSALGYGTGADAFQHWWLGADERIHLVGKGIVRFHAVYWPALLLSAGLPLPTHVLVHPYLTAGGTKISKSTGNVVDPFALVDRYGADRLRWWLLADVAPVADTDYTPGRFAARVDADLAHGLGNLASRVIGLRARCPGPVPTPPPTGPLAAAVDAALAAYDTRGAATAVLTAVAVANRDIELAAPWRNSGKGVERAWRASWAATEAALPLIPTAAAQILAGLSSGGRFPAPFPRLG